MIAQGQFRRIAHLGDASASPPITSSGAAQQLGTPAISECNGDGSGGSLLRCGIAGGLMSAAGHSRRRQARPKVHSCLQYPQ
jgi:hypothetical protein